MTARTEPPCRSRRRRPRWPLRAVLAAALLLGSARATAAAARPPQEAEGPLVVLAAASLTDVLPRLAAAWRASGGPEVRFSFGATSRLAPQIVRGAPADLFFSADREWMTWLEERGAVAPGTARVVAENELVVVVPGGSPAGPLDLARVPRLALAGENVPAGRYAREALARAGVWTSVERRVVRGGSVRAVLEWVALGEVPAGVVYRTDALAESDVRIAFPLDDPALRPRYWAAVPTGSARPAAARAFLDFVSSADGRTILAAQGFVPPGEAAGGPPVARQPSARPAGAPGQAPGGPERALAQEPAPGAVPDAASAIRVSLLVALLATAAGLVPAVGLGWALARREFPGKTLLSTAVLAPLVMPPVVTGFLLLSVLGTQSPFGRMLAGLGLPVPFTVLGAAVAALVVGLPLYVISVRGAFEAVDPVYEELSWTLGVPPRSTFLRVSLPLATPGIVAGAVLAFARALGEFGATVVLAGNVEGSTRTIALAVYTLLESPSGRETTWTLVGASVLLSLLALVGFERLSRRQRRRLEDRHAR